jgi:hypothetical protein
MPHGKVIRVIESNCYPPECIDSLIHLDKRGEVPIRFGDEGCVPGRWIDPINRRRDLWVAYRVDYFAGSVQESWQMACATYPAAVAKARPA